MFELYRIVHITGLVLMALGLGAVFAASRAGSEPNRKIGVRVQGAGLLLMLVAGFGLLARGNHSMTQGWVLGKIGVWVVLGMLPLLVQRKVLAVSAAWTLAVVLAAIAIWLAIAKPF